MYTPGYLTFLDNQKTRDGYPEFVTEEGKKYAEKIAKDLLEYGAVVALWVVVERIFENCADRPECFKNVALHDARDAVAYRALRAVNAKQVWTA